MKLRKNQSGFAIVELGVIVIVVAAIGLLAYYFYNHNHNVYNNDTGLNTSQKTPASNVSSAPAVSSVSDLNSAEQILDQNDPGTANNTDSSQLSSQLNGF